MSGSKAIGSGKILTFKDGTVVDETLFENNPLDETFHEVANESEEEKKGGAAGGGGGAGAKARPLAYIEIGPEGTHIRPIQDEQKIDLAGILLVAWVCGWIGLVLKTIFKK